MKSTLHQLTNDKNTSYDVVFKEKQLLSIKRPGFPLPVLEGALAVDKFVFTASVPLSFPCGQLPFLVLGYF